MSLYRSTLRWSLPFWGKHRAGRPLPSVYLNFQHPRCTPHSVTTWAVVSYTRLLTLTHRPFLRRGRSDGRLFSSALLSSRELLPIKKRITLCCPDFPLSVILTAAIGCPAAPLSGAKVLIYCHSIKPFHPFFLISSLKAPKNMPCNNQIYNIRYI